MLALAAVLLGSFMSLVDQFIVVIALPTIRDDLDTSLSTAELVIAAYALPYTVLLVTGGRLGDRWSPRTAYLAGMIVFTLASLACGLAPSPAVLVAARAVQGAAAALMTPQVLATIHTVFAPSERPRALSVLSGVNGSAAVLAQVAGGLLLALDAWGLSWRLVFLVNVPLGIAGIAAAAALVPARRGSPVPLDAGGVGLLTTALVLLTAPLVLGPQEGWPPWTFAALAAFVPATAVFGWYEWRLARSGRQPLVDPGLLAGRAVALGAAAALLLFAQAAGLFFSLTVVLQSGLGLGPLETGLLFAPLGSAFVAASLVAPRLLRRAGPGLVVAGFALAGIASAAAALVAARGDRPSVGTLVTLLTVATFGNGLAASPLFSLVLNGVRRSDSGLAAGTLSTAMQLGQLVGITVVGLVLVSALGVAQAGDADAYGGALAAALVANVGILVLGGALVALLVRSDGPSSVARVPAGASR